MDPEPVIGMGTHRRFDGPGERLGERHHRSVAPEVGREGSVDLDQMRPVGLPDRKGGEQRRAAAQRKDGGGRRRACLLSEELDEDPAPRPHVLIDDDGERLAAPQERQRGLRRTLVRQLAQASLPARREKAAVRGPAQPSRDGGELHAAPGGGTGEKLPVAEVRNGDDDSPPLRPRGLEAFPAAILDEVPEVAVRETARERDLGEALPQLSVGVARQAAPVALGKLWKGAAEPVEGDLAAEAEDVREMADSAPEPQAESRDHARAPRARSSAERSASSPARMRTSIGTASMGGGASRSLAVMRTRSFSVVRSLVAPCAAAARRRDRRSTLE